MNSDKQSANPINTLNQRLNIDFAGQAAGLGVWEVDPVTNQVVWDDRCRQLFGLAKDNMLPYEQAIQYIHPDDLVQVDQAVQWAMSAESDGVFDQTYRTIGADDGLLRWVRFQGRASFSPTGQLARYAGVAQDVTQIMLAQQILLEREAELAITNEELAATNEELMATNDEYVILNDELTESNSLLVRSNANLQQFAFIASHDLQEPLRKIQAFGDLLKARLKDSEGGDEMMYIDRMQIAASRMAILIKDLLAFSRISTQRNESKPVLLDEVVEKVLDMLDIAVLESGAQVKVETLPIVSGDATQLGQLFQNLLGNSLKFRRPGIAPLIRIHATLVAATALPVDIRPMRPALLYHCIEVTDNGIGFDAKYVDRIFQVFQRLHGKSQYPGTGIGLAICEKVVTNHGGIITAFSQPNQGATFIIYLPSLL